MTSAQVNRKTTFCRLLTLSSLENGGGVLFPVGQEASARCHGVRGSPPGAPPATAARAKVALTLGPRRWRHAPAARVEVLWEMPIAMPGVKALTVVFKAN